MLPIITAVVSIIVLFWFKDQLVRIVTSVFDVVDTNLDSINKLSKAGNKIAGEYSTTVDLNGLTRNYKRILEINAQRKTIGMQPLSDAEQSAMGIDTAALAQALAAGQINQSGTLPSSVKP